MERTRSAKTVITGTAGASTATVAAAGEGAYAAPSTGRRKQWD